MFGYFWGSSVMLAAVAAIFYAISAPLLKYGTTCEGAGTPSAMLMSYAVFGLVFAIIWGKIEMPISIGSGWRASVSVVVAGILLAAAFVCGSRAYAVPNASITIVATLVGSFPFLASLFEIIFMHAKVRPLMALVGCTLTIAGVIITTCSKV